MEEIELRNRQSFLANGGTAYDYVPALNDSDAQIALLTDLIARNLHGWDAGAQVEDRELAARAQRAGAQR